MFKLLLGEIQLNVVMGNTIYKCHMIGISLTFGSVVLLTLGGPTYIAQHISHGGAMFAQGKFSYHM